ncbi:hypothetical protein PVAG01_02483 [Phlyctema vagabunda]|uniref:Myb-like domain-containing protein n=1 Tax=Phlyctema vagabunda TaxID=108571 RepID=A0ABR4PRB1_9HELO
MPSTSQRRPRISFTSMLMGRPLIPQPAPKKSSRKASAPETVPVSAPAPAPAPPAPPAPTVEPAPEPTPEPTKPEEAKPPAEPKPTTATDKESRRVPHYSIKKLDGGQIQVTDRRTGEKTIFNDAKENALEVGEDGKVKIVLRVRKKNAKDKEIDVTKKTDKANPDQGAEPKVDAKAEETVKETPAPVEEEKKAADSIEKEEEVKMPGQWKSDDWSADQDATITRMKSDNRSWKDIAIEVGASKKDVQNRFKELQAAEAEATAEPASAEKKDDTPADGDGGFGDMGGLFDDAGGEAEPEKEKEPEKPKEKQDKKQKKQHKNKNGKENQPSKAPEPDKSEASAPASEENPAEKQSTQPKPQLEQQAARSLKADDIWTMDDCGVLEMLKERYEQHKWQHMQAGFFNFTGRMIGAELIEKKFRDDGLSLGGDA